MSLRWHVLFVLFNVTVCAAGEPSGPATRPSEGGYVIRPKADAPTSVLKFWAASQEMRPKQIKLTEDDLAKAEAELAAVKEGRIRVGLRLNERDRFGRWTFVSRQAKDEAVANAQRSYDVQRELLASRKSTPFAVVELLQAELGVLEVGDIGFVSDVNVVQVISESSMLAKIGKSEILWFSGVKTAGMVDGHTAKVGSFIEVTGTRRYVNAIGTSRTVFDLRPIDLSKHFVKVRVEK